VTPGATSLAELSAQLLACAEPAWLDAPLVELGSRLSDAEARDLLVEVYEAGDANSLRELLAREPLARWALDVATPHEQSVLMRQVRRWLGLGQSGSDDPARLVEVTPPPRELEALLAWARPNGVLDELIRPVSEVVPGAGEIAPESSVAECCVGSWPDAAVRGSALARDRLVEDTRGYLQREAASHASLRARTELWSRTPVPALKALFERLRGLTVRASAPTDSDDADRPATPPGVTLALPVLHGASFVPARPVSIDRVTGVCRGQLRMDPNEPPRFVRVYLSGYEQRALHAECECEVPTCRHTRALAARLIDACLDPKDRLHAGLLEFVREPSWQRFVRALQPEAPSAETSADRVSFRIRLDGERARVGSFLHKPSSGDRLTAGKLASPHKLARARGCNERDRPVLELMSALSRSLGARYVTADLTLLRALVEHPQLELEWDDASREPVHVTEHTVQLQLLEQPEGLLPKLTLAGVAIKPGARRRELTYLLAHERASHSLAVAALTPPLRRLLAALADFHGVLPPQSYPLLGPWLASMRQVAQVSAPAALRGSERPTPNRLLLRITPRLDVGVDVVLVVRALPLGALWPPGHGPALVDGLEHGIAVHARRDLDWERSAADRVIQALHLNEHMRLEPFAYRIDSTQAALALLSEAARLHDLLEIEWAENARRFTLTAPIRTDALKVDLCKRGQWIELSGGAISADADVAIGRLLDAVRLGERFVRVQGNDYAEIERDLFERLERAQLCVMDPQRAPAIARAALPFWLSQFDAQTSAADTSASDWLTRLRARPDEADAPDVIDPVWRERLRDYQLRGVAWLLASSRWADGVCLADEMGLGKTVQTIALLCARAPLGAALIIAPTSVVGNWQNELARFAPELEVRLYRGAHRRERPAGLGPGCVLIGSYEILLRDRASFEELSFATQVVDEAQVIRNARTRRARAVAGIQSAFRVALTGTPVENRLGDLWSLFSWIAPGLLGSWPRFRARFAVPIERYENVERAAQLRALIAPFLLRRTKDEVARELPSRTEVVHLIEPSPAERALYATAAQRARRAFGRRSREQAGHPVQILAALTQLRLLASHPRLVIDDARVESSKLAAFMQLLEDILPRGHRVLVFSQFVRHLQIVREALEAAAISFVYLDGSTPAGERGELVERFQRGDVQAFLISLKAGGTGLNLTAADYVVHMDPWWNPAAEDQASDRAHRLGQARPVTVVKLVARGTIEEKVLGLHAHKRRLAEAALGTEPSEGANPGRIDAALLEELLR
jgi:superfamily II DNA or RNA helicase